MIFRTRKLIKPEDLNPRGTLFGGQLLKWIDEEAAIYCICQLNTPNVVTKVMSEVDFIASARLGDVIEIGCEMIKLGTTSITIKCVVRNKDTQRVITAIDKIVFVAVDEQGNPTPHNKTK
ncbi:MAG: hypothetical protein RL728_777 [Bacteroidota bacterium]|jgi:acyl-CoA hydrolase